MLPCLLLLASVLACLPAHLPDRRRKQRLPRVYTDAYVPRRRPSTPSSGASVLSPDLCLVRALRLSASSCFAAQLTCLSNGRERHCSCTLAVCSTPDAAVYTYTYASPSPAPQNAYCHQLGTLTTARPDALSARRHYSYGPPAGRPRFLLNASDNDSASPCPAFQNAYVLRTLCCAPARVPETTPSATPAPQLGSPSLCRVCLLRCAACTPTVCLARDAASPCPAPRNACSRLLRAETAFGRPPQHAATSSPSQPHDGPVSCSNGSNYASASPFPVFQNAYALRTPFSAVPCRVPPILPPPRHQKPLRTALPCGVHLAYAPTAGRRRVLLERLQLRLCFTFPCVPKRICVTYALFCTVPACRPGFLGAAAA